MLENLAVTPIQYQLRSTMMISTTILEIQTLSPLAAPISSPAIGNGVPPLAASPNIEKRANWVTIEMILNKCALGSGFLVIYD